ncbi:pyridoxamine 5'-phosphate oxidase family protein [Maribacter sp. HTCC2170]|uniref:pyridoxamine 5'-phosphate oxidase family protein n=1 Tax=Maribacter sp. (strain HTCC2170 / KCCM 42371) TaxID=313603 RepID=UPI00006BB13A|nr:pyridoxamine 5'-phosphate oxidase family protein [Maribacter sp. HTCC2170]EAQ99622.1 hypothetical protein FB2170_00165 [Maribacter sp. HTCC2170]
MNYTSDIVFTPAVKKFQEQFKSRNSYARMEQFGGWNSKVSSDLEGFLKDMDSFYFGSANADGQPYIQHRGGKKGFLKVVDNETLAFADFSGNKQYISIGNLSENNKATIFLMHYVSQTRIKIWGTAYVDTDESLIASLRDENYNAKIERAIVFKVKAWDVNCKQHIKQRFAADEIKKITEPLESKIKTLETTIDHLKSNN